MPDSHPDDDELRPLAGSPDDRRVTLAPPRRDASTWTRQGVPRPAVGPLLEACDAASGRYVEQGIIGRGGMGEVALCIERNIRRPVAMKRLLEAVADDDARRARFVEEAQVTGQLQHPNIVPVYELDRDAQGTIYFTMKPVRGASLADLLRPLPPGEGARPPAGGRAGEGAASEGGLPYADGRVGAGPRARPTREQGQPLGPAPPSLADLLAIFMKVCDGVAYAHSRGVIHRDLKPSNIMVGDFGEVLVMDWGLAKIVGREDIRADELVTSDRLESTPELTLDGTAMGTPAYMPPEQANGELDKIDHRSDIYSLGAILYEILTLEKPVEGSTPLILLANAAHGNIVPPEKRTPGRAVPRELSAIAMKCLAKSRARRYASVVDLQHDVRRYLEGRSVLAAPDTFAQAVAKLVKRNKGVSAAIAAAAAILIAVVSVAFARVTAARTRAVRGETAAVSEREKRRQTALAASRGLAEAALRAADEGRFADADFRAGAAAEVMPDGPWGEYALGVVAFKQKEFATARRHLEAAQRLDPAHEPSKVSLALVLAASGELVKWEALLAGAGEGSDWRTLVAAGDAFMLAQRHAQAAAAYQRALTLLSHAPAVVVATRKGLEDKAARAAACVATEDLAERLRAAPPKQRGQVLVATLKEIYGSDLEVNVDVENEIVTGIRMHDPGDAVRWLDPVRALSLTSLSCGGSSLVDLAALKGMPLTRLQITGTRVTDLSPLRGMPLTRFECRHTPVSDLSPLKGMPLTYLDCDETRVSDLSPLAGMPLVHLRCGQCKVSDLTPLKGMRLRHLKCRTNTVPDLTPLEGMPLEFLDIHNTGVLDLSPLRGMPLKTLICGNNRVRDLRPLKGMPLRTLAIYYTEVNDLTPLAGLPLKELTLPARKQLTPESLELVETLERQGCRIEESQ